MRYVNLILVRIIMLLHSRCGLIVYSVVPGDEAPCIPSQLPRHWKPWLGLSTQGVHGEVLSEGNRDSYSC